MLVAFTASPGEWGESLKVTQPQCVTASGYLYARPGPRARVSEPSVPLLPGPVLAVA